LLAVGGQHQVKVRLSVLHVACFGRIGTVNWGKERGLTFVAEGACVGKYVGSKGDETGSRVARTAPAEKGRATTLLKYHE
jgi:hypothetical protein